MSAISVPVDLIKNHGKDVDEVRQMGAKFAETFETTGGLREDDAVLDIGCGPGRMAIGVGERFQWKNRYVGFDILKKDIDFCAGSISSQHPSFQFHHIDIYNSHYNPKGIIASTDVLFPAGDGSIDFAFATSIFTHLFTAETEHYLKEVARVLRPTGRLLSTWFVLDDVSRPLVEAGKARFRFPHRQDDGASIEFQDRPADIVGHDIESIERMHKAAGLAMVLTRGAWSKFPDHKLARHSQDVIVSRPA